MSCVFTIGHSNRTLEHFVAMLREASIETVVDVRSFPRSRTNPQFDADSLPQSLAPYQIGYQHWPELGGRRPRQKAVRPQTNDLWLNPSFHNFADYALGSEFQTALDRLVALTQSSRPALMCSEAVWWRCHRRIIADHLLARGLPVFHIMELGKTVEAKLMAGATVAEDHRVRYPAQ